MNPTFVQRILCVSLLLLATLSVRATEEDDLIAKLQSTTSAPERWTACQRLRLLGSTKAVPALAGLLTDDRASHAARLTLEGLPGPEAGDVLRAALPKTSGLIKAGIIESLGWRQEPVSVPLLAPLLSDADGSVAAAAAAALGRIAGREAVQALLAARDQASATVRPVLQESLFKCAERFLSNQDNPSAAKLYRDLVASDFPPHIRAAAWRGLVLAEPNDRPERMANALAGEDAPIRAAALKLLRDLDDRTVLKACLSKWAALPVEAQLALLDAQVKLGAVALPTVQTASQSKDVRLRTAAWQAMGELSDLTSIPILTKAAAQGEPVERDAARTSLSRLQGAGARDALLAHLEAAPSQEKAELLLALGDRGDRLSLNVLLRNAGSDTGDVQLAALESLRKLAPPEAIAPLLEIGAKATADAQREAVFKALYAVCEASPDKNATALSIVQSMARFPAAERRHILPLLAELATPAALEAAQTASRDADQSLAKEAVQVLARWPNAAPATQLLELAGTALEPTLQTLALRGAIEVAGQEPDLAKRFVLLKRSLSAAKQPDEKRQALGQLGQVGSREALDLALAAFTEPDLRSEAGLAAVGIAEKLAPSEPKLADEVGAKVLAQFKEGDLARRAWSLRIRPSSAEAFIRDWAISGPYRQAGITGAEAVFKIVFGPEKPNQSVEWKTVRGVDSVNLSALFPGQDNCAAYLRTQITAPDDCEGALLLGSDDGIKAWLNGQVVHSKNVDRGQVVDQDAAPIKLKKGANDLLLKVSQGGGGWSACARIVGVDGKPIPGLLVEVAEIK